MSKHVGVVGGGIIGLCCAYFLAQEGHRVTLVDRGAPVDENCSFGNAGLVVPSHIVPMAAPGMVTMGLKWMRDPQSPFYVKPRLSPDLLSWGWKFYRVGNAAHVKRSAPLLRDLNMASRAAYEELDSELGDFDFQQDGLLMLFKTQAGLDEEAHVAEHAQRLGMPSQVLDAGQTAQLEPALKLDVLGSVYYPHDCHMSPGKLMARLQAELRGRSADLRWSTEVTGWQTAGKRVRAAILDGGTTSSQNEALEADEWVLCGGSWSPQTARDLKLRLPLQAGKGYSITLPHSSVMPSKAALLMEARVAVTPMGGKLRFAGTMEIAGLNTEVSQPRVQGIVNAVPRYYPEFVASDYEGLKAWAGLRPCSPDGLPYVGRTAKYDNLCVATGHAMMGLSLGPITGKLIAQTVTGREPQFASTLLNPDRYG